MPMIRISRKRKDERSVEASSLAVVIFRISNHDSSKSQIVCDSLVDLVLALQFTSTPGQDLRKELAVLTNLLQQDLGALRLGATGLVCHDSNLS